MSYKSINYVKVNYYINFSSKLTGNKQDIIIFLTKISNRKNRLNTVQEFLIKTRIIVYLVN